MTNLINSHIGGDKGGWASGSQKRNMSFRERDEQTFKNAGSLIRDRKKARLDPKKQGKINSWIKENDDVYEDQETLKKRIARFGGDEKLLGKASDDEMADATGGAGLAGEVDGEDQEKLKARMAKFGTGQVE